MKKKIIIIDDRPLLRHAWSIILESSNKYLVVGKLPKTAELAEILREKKPDVVILDISIKQLHGFPIIKVIRKFSPLSRIIGISLQLEHVYARKLLRAGAKGFVDKDCPAEELLEAVETVLKGKIYVCKDFKLGGEIKTVAHDSETFRRLSKRELEIIQLVRRGLSSREIGSEISIAPKTVDTHRRNILKKLHLKNSTALIQFVHAHGI
jgi:two-component system invasion response regulator UvrY